MAYDRVVVDLNAARLRGTSFPVIHAFIQAALSLNPDVRAILMPASFSYLSTIPQRTHQVIQLFHILAKITGEPPGTPPLAHAGAHILNTPLMERRHARAYLGGPASREAVELRKQIASGARAALEEQYLDVLERTLQARPLQAQLGGDPTIANRVRAFLLVRYYRGGEWQDRIEVRLALVVLKPITNDLNSWLRLSLYGPSYSISYAPDMREKLSTKRLLTGRLLSIVRIALSPTSVFGWSLPIVGVLFAPSSA